MNILVPSGIGDYSWMHSKLSTLGVSLDVVIADEGYPRLTPFLEMLPCVKSIASKKMPFRNLRKASIPPSTSSKALLDRTDCIPMEANTFLEHGNRLEKWLPDMGLDFHYKVDITEAHIAAAEAHARSLLDSPFPFLCIYAANETTCKTWKGWMGKEWADFLHLFRKDIADIPVAFVGAEWDRSLADKVLQVSKQKGTSPIVDLVGKLELGATFHIIRSSAYFVSFPSGLGILANVMRRPTTMFYPKVSEGLMRTWADPETIKSGEFRECLFPAPDALASWLRDDYKLQGKLW